MPESTEPSGLSGGSVILPVVAGVAPALVKICGDAVPEDDPVVTVAGAGLTAPGPGGAVGRRRLRGLGGFSGPHPHWRKHGQGATTSETSIDCHSHCHHHMVGKCYYRLPAGPETRIGFVSHPLTSRSPALQREQIGRTSSHFTRRARHVRQPLRLRWSWYSLLSTGWDAIIFVGFVVEKRVDKEEEDQKVGEWLETRSGWIWFRSVGSG